MANANYTEEIQEKRASVKQVEKTATLLMERSGGGGGIDFPASDGKYYAVKDGEWAELKSATLIAVEPYDSGAQAGGSVFELVKTTAGYAHFVGPHWIDDLECFVGVQNAVNLYTSKNGNTWEYKSGASTVGASGRHMEYVKDTGYLYLPGGSKKIVIAEPGNSTPFKLIAQLTVSNTLNGCCYSPELKRTVFLPDTVLTSGSFPYYVDDDTPLEAKKGGEIISEKRLIWGNYFTKIAWSPSLELFCAVYSVSTGSSADKGVSVALSADGINWEIVPIFSDSFSYISDVCWLDDYNAFLIWLNNTPYVSFDGRAWIPLIAHSIEGINGMRNVLYVPEIKSVVATEAKTGTCKIFISNDCKNWGVLGTVKGSNGVYGITWSSKLSKFAMVAQDGSSGTNFYTLQL